jgi:hypothetical protein
VIVQDTIPPIFVNVTNITAQDNITLSHNINTIDTSGVSCFSINDTTNFNINCSGILTNATSLSVGIYSLNITVNDTYNNQNSTIISINITDIDITPPSAAIIGPANATITSNASINFTINASDNQGLANAILYIFNQTGLYNQTTISFGGVTNIVSGVVVTLVGGAVYTWFWEVFDLAGNMFSTQTQEGNRTITTIPGDTTVPIVNLISPSGETIESNQTFSCNLTDNIQIQNLTLYLWNSSSLVITNSTNLIGTSNSTSFTYNLTSYNNYTWNCYGCDNSSNCAVAASNFSLNYTITYNILNLNESLSLIDPISLGNLSNVAGEKQVLLEKAGETIANITINFVSD